MNTLLRALLIGLVASTLIVACSQKTEEAKVNPANTIEAANAKWNKALNSGNVKELAALYTENATLSPGNGKTIVGRAEIENLFKGFVDGGVHNHTLEIIEVGGTGKMIYQVAKWKAQGAEANGKTPSFGGITTSVLEQGSDGNWLTRTHIWNVNQ
ncbi:MAG TPA: SgcJ/EcaC family oxidoreductase [Methylotenera sp.]|jgi:uncharacterized protein (TIGR02246 family)|nr:SgcJ/EcaC family oxidoreductase [Methylotenera sp.]